MCHIYYSYGGSAVLASSLLMVLVIRFFFQKTTTKGRWKRFRWSMALLNFFNIWRGVLQISQMCACRHYIKLYKIWNEKRTFKCEKLPSLSALVNTVPFLDFANPC